MIKLIMSAFAFGALVMSGVTASAQPQNGCSNAPKNYVPCYLSPVIQQQSKSKAQ